MQISIELLCIEFACLYLANNQNLTHYVIMVIWPHFLCRKITTICYASNSCAYPWITLKIQPIISPWLCSNFYDVCDGCTTGSVCDEIKSTSLKYCDVCLVIRRKSDKFTVHNTASAGEEGLCFVGFWSRRFVN